MTKNAIPARNPASPIYARQNLERSEMRILAAWLDLRPGLVWCHCPNESQASVSHRVMQARCGLKPGVPDVLIFDSPPGPRRPLSHVDKRLQGRYVGCALELKAGKGRATESQRWWLDELARCGWICSVQVGATASIKWLTDLGY